MTWIMMRWWIDDIIRRLTVRERLCSCPNSFCAMANAHIDSCDVVTRENWDERGCWNSGGDTYLAPVLRTRMIFCRSRSALNGRHDTKKYLGTKLSSHSITQPFAPIHHPLLAMDWTNTNYDSSSLSPTPNRQILMVQIPSKQEALAHYNGMGIWTGHSPNSIPLSRSFWPAFTSSFDSCFSIIRSHLFVDIFGYPTNYVGWRLSFSSSTTHQCVDIFNYPFFPPYVIRSFSTIHVLT